MIGLSEMKSRNFAKIKIFNMESYTYREALENVVGYLFNPIMKRQNPDLYESARIIKEHLDMDEEIDRAEELADLYICGCI